ncbi:MAG: PIN domain-containing protein [Chloroflexi bacterium]|nr:PIN domain-containing protein [Chloroflexota bacterium]
MLLLDTDVMIDLLREYPPAVKWISTSSEEIVLPGYVVMELIQGCKSKVEQERLEKTLGAYAIAWASPQVCDEALAVFARYYLSHNVGIFDALIGQLAVSMHTTLHTFNQKHYTAIPNLKMVQPYQKDLALG